jgi:hypothetical protein
MLNKSTEKRRYEEDIFSVSPGLVGLRRRINLSCRLAVGRGLCGWDGGDRVGWDGGHLGLGFATAFIVRVPEVIIRSVSRTKAKAFGAVPKMGDGLPEPACRSWLQTARCCCVSKGVVVNDRGKGVQKGR